MKVIMSKDVVLKVAEEAARIRQTISPILGLKAFGDESFVEKILGDAKKDLEDTGIIEQRRFAQIEKTETDIIIELSDNFIQDYMKFQHKLVSASIPVIGAALSFASFAKDSYKNFEIKWDQKGALK